MITVGNSGYRILKRDLYAIPETFSLRLKLFHIKSWKHVEELRRYIKDLKCGGQNDSSLIDTFTLPLIYSLTPWICPSASY